MSLSLFSFPNLVLSKFVLSLSNGSKDQFGNENKVLASKFYLFNDLSQDIIRGNALGLAFIVEDEPVA